MMVPDTPVMLLTFSHLKVTTPYNWTIRTDDSVFKIGDGQWCQNVQWLEEEGKIDTRPFIRSVRESVLSMHCTGKGRARVGMIRDIRYIRLDPQKYNQMPRGCAAKFGTDSAVLCSAARCFGSLTAA